MPKVLLVMLGGSVGSLCRYGIALGLGKLLGAGFPWGTLCVNLSGSLLIGAAFELGQKGILKPDARLLLITGFLGGLTTFSSFALETVNLFRGENGGISSINFLINNFGGFSLVITGIWVIRALF